MSIANCFDNRYNSHMLNPAHDIISALGGNGAVAELCGVTRATVWKWSQDRKKGGTGGIIPVEHAPKIVDAGKKIGLEVPLTAFIPGAAKEVSAHRGGKRRGRKPERQARAA